MALFQSVQKDPESKADGCQESGVEFDINSHIKSTIPTDLLPVGVVAGVEKFHTFC